MGKNFETKLPKIENDPYFPEEIKDNTDKGNFKEPTDLHTSQHTNKQTEEQTKEHLIVSLDTQTNIRLNLYLSIYTFKATKEQINKGSFKPSNIEISEEMRMAMDKLISIYLDGIVANDTDKTYKDIVNNALFEYLIKKFKQLQNAN